MCVFIYIYIDMCMLYVYVYVYYIRAGHAGSAFDSLEGLVWGVPKINSGFVGDFGTPTKPCGVMQIFPRITRNVPSNQHREKQIKVGCVPKSDCFRDMSYFVYPPWHYPPHTLIMAWLCGWRMPYQKSPKQSG
jgi:hypothetical protein